jgi:hypothetical protein
MGGDWGLVFTAPTPVDVVGYQALCFAFHPGDLQATDGIWLNLSLLSEEQGGEETGEVDQEILDNLQDEEGMGQTIDGEELPGPEEGALDAGDVPVEDGETSGLFEDTDQGGTLGAEEPLVEDGETPGLFEEDTGETVQSSLDLLNLGLDGPGVDLEVKAWQVVEILLAVFSLPGAVRAIRLAGNLQGSFYLADIRLVTAASLPGTAVREEWTQTEPAGFELGQNYPNPFNSQTVIRFALPIAAEVELGVYNMAEQKVATLLQGRREAGLYTASWDGRDEAGRRLASGLYLYRMKADSWIETRKLLLLR